MTGHRMSVQLLIVIYVLQIAASTFPHVAAAEWSQFRGQNCSGLAEAANELPHQFGPQQNVIWKCDVTRGLSSPCIQGGHVFLTAFNADEKQLIVMSVNRATGKVVWKKSVAAKSIEKVHKVSCPASATVVADERHAIAYFGSSGLVCFDHAGNQVWHHVMPCAQRFNGSGTSPILVGDLVILNREDDRESYLLAVNSKTGDVAWKTEHPGSGGFGEATPLIKGQQIILHRQNEVAAYSLADGKRLWSFSLRTTAASTPVIRNDVLYVAAWNNFGEADLKGKLPPFAKLLEKSDKNGDGKLSRSEMPWGPAVARRPELAGRSLGANMPVKFMFGSVDSNHDGQIDEAEWQAAPDRTDAIIQSSQHGLTALRLPKQGGDPTSLWQINKSVPEVPSPLVVGAHVYMIKNGGILTCADSGSGEVAYRRRMKARGLYLASPIAVRDKVIVASEPGIVSVFRAGDSFELLHSVDFGEPISATPAIADGILYVRTDSALYAFGE